MRQVPSGPTTAFLSSPILMSWTNSMPGMPTPGMSSVGVFTVIASAGSVMVKLTGGSIAVALVGTDVGGGSGVAVGASVGTRVGAIVAVAVGKKVGWAAGVSVGTRTACYHSARPVCHSIDSVVPSHRQVDTHHWKKSKPPGL